MKKFKIYSLTTSYFVLKCPHCNSVFRHLPTEKVFGKPIKNTKCQKCEKSFEFEPNCLDYDPVFRP